MADQSVLAGGLVERIGLAGTRLRYRDHLGRREEHEVAVADYAGAVRLAVARLTRPGEGVLASAAEIAAVGHRLVHAGEKITGSVFIDEEVKAVMTQCFPLAPLHNPPNLEGVKACEAIFPGLPQVGVFDTAFHATMPPVAYLYGLPYELYERHGLRRYGFHGTSHRYVCRRAAAFLGRPLEELKIVSCHLGNGSSLAAVAGGRSVDTSMGLTPLEGVFMGTRCGDLDPGVLLFLLGPGGMDRARLDRLLNKESGFLGLAGVGSSDLRDIEAHAARGHPRASLALEAFAYRIRKYVGAYAAAMGGLDALVFTAGIGENSDRVRSLVCRDLEFLGIELDPARNQARQPGERSLQAAGGRVAVLVVPTNEELEIALETLRLMPSAPGVGRRRRFRLGPAPRSLLTPRRGLRARAAGCGRRGWLRGRRAGRAG